MINFHEIYSLFSDQMPGNQRKITVNSCLEVYFGYNYDKNLRLSFMSKGTPPQIESTKILHVVQGRENKDTYWTSFDLLNSELKEAYLSFCENLVSSVTGISDESVALNLLGRRFITWKTLFKKIPAKDVSKEKLLGVFGELTVLKNVIAPLYGMDTAIRAWGGPNMQSKDFTVGDTWYEVKTIGANSDRIRISSLTQLSSEYTGHLTLVRAETTSPEFGGPCSSLLDLINEIILAVNDESLENLLIEKIRRIGIDVYGKECTDRFDVKSITNYRVNELFPRITSSDVPYSEIISVQYEISVAAINAFKEE